MNREPGFYWVKLPEKWLIAEWRIDNDHEYWRCNGTDRWYDDDDSFIEIDERRIEREPVKQPQTFNYWDEGIDYTFA